MRADERPRYCLGDWVTLSSGWHAGLEGQVIDLTFPNPHVGRARLRLPGRDDHWHPFWNEPMTEQEWLMTEDAAGMERYLRLLDPPISSRKWMLYECPLVRFALPPAPVADPRGGLLIVQGSDPTPPLSFRPPRVAGIAMPADLLSYVFPGHLNHDDLHAIGTSRVALLREVFGNPFHRPTIDPAWLTGQSGLVRRLAEEIIDDRHFGELPVLADALEEAGCRDEALLTHLRAKGPHVLGCWALDAVLGLC